MHNNTERIGIIGAMQIEVDALRADMEDARSEIVSGVTYTCGRLCGREVVVCASGVGKVFAAIAAEAMILRFGVTALLNTGVAGGLAPTLNVGDIVIADAVVQHDMNTTALGDPRGFLSGPNTVKIETDKRLTTALSAAAREAGLNTLCGTVASGDLFVAEEKTKCAIRRDFGAVACEMEGAAIGAAAYMSHVPFAVLRAISDGGDGMEFSAFVQMAASRSVRVTKLFLEKL